MDVRRLTDWVEAYRRAWESNAVEDIGALFADDASYYTAPYREPWQGRDAIVSGWLEHKDEPEETEFRYEVVAVCEGIGFVRGWTTYSTSPPTEYSNLWMIRLAGDGRASEFTEWWMEH